MDYFEIAKKIVATLSATGFFAFSIKLGKNYLKNRKAESNKKEQDRELFLKLVDEVQEIKVDVKGIKTKMRGLEESQRNRMNAQGLAFWESDIKGMTTYVSPSLQMMLGQPEQKILGAGWVNLLHEEDRDKIREAWEFSVEFMTIFDEVYRFNTSAGTVIKVHGLAFHNKDDDGNYTSSFGQLTIYK